MGEEGEGVGAGEEERAAEACAIGCSGRVAGEVDAPRGYDSLTLGRVVNEAAAEWGGGEDVGGLGGKALGVEVGVVGRREKAAEEVVGGLDGGEVRGGGEGVVRSNFKTR